MKVDNILWLIRRFSSAHRCSRFRFASHYATLAKSHLISSGAATTTGHLPFLSGALSFVVLGADSIRSGNFNLSSIGQLSSETHSIQSGSEKAPLGVVSSPAAFFVESRNRSRNREVACIRNLQFKSWFLRKIEHTHLSQAFYQMPGHMIKFWQFMTFRKFMTKSSRAFNILGKVTPKIYKLFSLSLQMFLIYLNVKNLKNLYFMMCYFQHKCFFQEL